MFQLPRAELPRRSLDRILLRALGWSRLLLIACALIGFADQTLAWGQVPQARSLSKWFQKNARPIVAPDRSTFSGDDTVAAGYSAFTTAGRQGDLNPNLYADRNFLADERVSPIPATGPFVSQSTLPSYVPAAGPWPPQPETDSADSWSDDLAAQFCPTCTDSWSWQLMPSGLVWRAYLASRKESRFSSAWVNESEAQDLWTGGLWDITLGGRAGILRYGTRDGLRPQGFQLDIEGAGFPRLDLDIDSELISADFRFGVPLTYARNGWEYKFAYYHLSSHLGDEFIVRNPGIARINFSRDVMITAMAYRPTKTLRLYAEMGYAIHDDVSKPWEFQFGVDYAPGVPTGFRGAPFAAVNAHLREEVDFGGNFVAQAGWAWLGDGPGRLFRVGVEYVNGKSTQFEFFNRNEQQIGTAIWFDF